MSRKSLTNPTANCEAPFWKLNKRAMVMGFLGGLVGLVVGLYFSLSLGSSGRGNYFFLWTTFSAFCSSYLLWWLIVERSGILTPNRAGLVGILSPALAHCFTFFSLYVTGIFYGLFTGDLKLMGDLLIDLPMGFLGSLVFGAFSLILIGGWVTLPAGFLIGHFYGKYLINKATQKEVI